VSLLVRARTRLGDQARRAGPPGANLPPDVEPVVADHRASGVSESGIGVGGEQRAPVASAPVDLLLTATSRERSPGGWFPGARLSRHGADAGSWRARDVVAGIGGSAPPAPGPARNLSRWLAASSCRAPSMSKRPGAGLRGASLLRHHFPKEFRPGASQAPLTKPSRNAATRSTPGCRPTRRRASTRSTRDARAGSWRAGRAWPR
jgi:hypothetical protein